MRGQGRQQVESRDAEGVNHAVRAAGDHGHGVAAADDFRRFADGLAARRARRQAVDVGPLGVEHAADVAGRHVGLLFQFRHRIERFQPHPGELPHVQTIAGQGGRHHAGERLEVLVSFPAAQVHAQIGRREPAVQNARRIDRLPGSTGRKTGMPAAVLPEFGIVNVPGHVEVLDLGTDFRRETAGVEDRRIAHTGAAFLQRGPDRFRIVSQRIDATNSRDDDPVSHG